MILSVIVPSYNAEKYIPSFEKYFYSPSLVGKVEFLLIDDGSSDNTFELMINLSDKHPGYFKAFRKENGGHGSAINYGLEKASGTFFKVIDSDDSLSVHELDGFVAFLSNNLDVDLVVSDFVRYYVATNKKEYVKSYFMSDDEKKNSNAIHGYPFLQLHSMTYSLRLWKENSIRVREKCFYEDQEYCVYPLPYVHSCVYYPHPTYIYHIGVAGQSISNDGIKKHKNDHSLCIQDLLNYYSLHCKDVFPYKDMFVEYVAFAARNHYENIMLANEPRNLRREILNFDNLLRGFPEIRKKARKWKIVKGLTFFHCAFSLPVSKILLRRSNRAA